MLNQSNQLDLKTIILRLDGIPSPRDEVFHGEGFFLNSMGSWRPLVDDSLYEIEGQCIELHNELAARIFGSLNYYHELLPMTPSFLAEAGLNSESVVGRDFFEKLLQELVDFPELNRFLYLFDCRMLVSAIQECTKEISQITGEFYRILNIEPFFYPSIAFEDGVRWSTSPVVTNLNSTLCFLFIRMHSLLDYLAKLAKETENLRVDFTNYPRLASSNFLFGQRSKLRINQREDSLFEDCDEVTEVELMRNLFIHDGLLDDIPKAYEVIQEGEAVERFILMPDRKNGHLERFKNRRLFYSREDKINLRLAGLVHTFQLRELETLKGIREGLKATGTNE